MKKDKTISIKAKLLGTIIPVVIVIVVVLVVVAYQISAGIIEDNAANLLKTSVGSQESKIEAWINENLASFQMAKKTIEDMHADDDQIQKILDGYYNYSENYPDGLYLADSDGKILKASKSTKEENNATDSTWYKEGLTRVNMAVGTAYKNADGENVISASGILNDGSDDVRVISADMSLDGAEALLVDKNSGMILANRDSALISKTLGESGQSALYRKIAKKISQKNYDLTTLDGNMTVFDEVNGTDWILVSYIPKSVVLSELSNLRNIMLIISLICILILCVLIERMTHVVISPVKKMTKVITAMAGGDFTVSMKVKGKDEIAVMGRSVEQFIESMKQMIKKIEEVSGKLKEQADASKNVSGEMNEAAGIQSQSMGEMNSTVDQLSISVNEIAQNATQLAGVVADTKSDSDTVENRMKETVEVSEKGREDMERVGEALGNIEVSIHNLETAVNKVGTASGEIVQIINLIGEIADETNLLSLNASIEAARAGEAGKGFAVVASEIGKLAQNSTESVANITNLIAEINRLVEDAVRQAGNSAGDISESAQLIQKAVDTFDTIFKNIQDTSHLIDNVVDEINKVDEVASNVAAISEEQAASSDEILATSESMLNQTENISKNSQQVEEESDKLANSADHLADQIKQFKI